MTAVWAWADLGDNCLQQYNIRQYWLLMSVLSVKKFNPDWKRVFIVDQITYDFIVSRSWQILWDEIKVINFKNTEYGDLTKISIYSWPKIYSYGLIDDDMLVMDIDIVFLKPFEIPDRNKVCGQYYNFMNYITNRADEPAFNMRGHWPAVIRAFKFMDKYNLGLNYRFEQDTVILVGSPIYIPKGLGKYIQTEVLEHIIEVETLDNRYDNKLISGDVFWAIEEEYPITEICKRCKGICCLNRNLYRHGFTNSCYWNIDSGFPKPEALLEIPVYEKYLKPYENF